MLRVTKNMKHAHARRQGHRPSLEGLFDDLPSIPGIGPHAQTPRGDEDSDDSESEDEDGDDTERARPGATGGSERMGNCPIACLSVALGNDCRSISCMCTSDSLPDARACISATCSRDDQRAFLSNVDNWCTAQVGSAISAASSSASRAAPSSVLSASEVSSAASDASSSVVTSSRVSSEVTSSVVSSSSLSVPSSVITSKPLRASAASPPPTIATSLRNATDDSLAKSVDQDNDAAGNSKKGLSPGTVAGIVVGMIVAFALVGLCIWQTRRMLLGRTSRAKQYLRNSDPGDWVDSGKSEKEGEQAREIDMSEKNEDLPGERRSRALLAAGTAAAATAWPISHQGNVHPGAAGARGNPAGTTFVEDESYPASPSMRNQMHWSIQQQQYMQLQAQMAHPASMYGHPGFLAGGHQSFHSGAASSNAAHLSHSSMLSSPSSGLAYPSPLTAEPGSAAGSDVPLVSSPLSAGYTSGHLVTGEPYSAAPLLYQPPARGQHNSIAISNHSSTGFGIPMYVPGHKPSPSTSSSSSRRSQMHNKAAGHSGSRPRNLTGSSVATSMTGPVDVTPHSTPQRRGTQQFAATVPLPMSPPSRAASLPMPLPGTDGASTSAQSSFAQQKQSAWSDSTNGTNGDNPFLDTVSEIETSAQATRPDRESFEGLAYLTSELPKI